MAEFLIPTTSTIPKATKACVGRTVPTVHSTYGYYEFGIEKKDVIARSYDLWRRPW